MNKIISITFICFYILMLSACGTAHKGIMETEKSQVQLRSMQTRTFETNNKKNVMRSVIATLQDLSFVIDQADYDIGTIKATKLSGYNLTMSVSVRPQDQENMMVRASARYNNQVIEDPKPYQDFFTALSKGLFLDANNI